MKSVTSKNYLTLTYRPNEYSTTLYNKYQSIIYYTIFVNFRRRVMTSRSRDVRARMQVSPANSLLAATITIVTALVLQPGLYRLAIFSESPVTCVPYYVLTILIYTRLKRRTALSCAI